MKRIVMSYGRPELQLTLQSLPKDVLSTVELWVVPSEYKAYKRGWYAGKVKAIECWPKEVDCVPKKRCWALQYINDDYILIDDDLKLRVWHKDRYVTHEDAPKAFAREWLERFPAQFKKYAGVSLGNKFMADPWVRANGVFKKNNVGFCVSGFSKSSPRKDIAVNRVFTFTDVSLPLQMFQKTGSSLIYYGLCYDHARHKDLSSTGTSSYRDDFTMLDSAVKMAQMFPGIVTGAKHTGNHGGGVTLTKFFSRVKKGVSEKNKLASLKYLGDICSEHGLRKPPKPVEYGYDVPRAELLFQFKKEWDRLKG